MVDYVRYWSKRTGIRYRRIIQWIGIPRSKFYQWQQRYGMVNQHNGWIPRDFWLRDWEKQAILDFWGTHSREGYRRMTYMMLDSDVVAVSPSTVYRLLQNAGVLHRWNQNKNCRKGQGFQQPLKAHEHWHIDISYLNIHGTFYYLCSVLDGYSRFLVAWDIRESMTEQDVEIVLQRARERFPQTRPRIISDNGPQFIAKDFKQFIRLCGMTHVRTSPYYPQSNGKLERWNQSAKVECIRPKSPLSLEDARRIVAEYVLHYNTVRLHSAIGYITPLDMLEARAEQIFAARDAKLEAARQARTTAAMAPRPAKQLKDLRIEPDAWQSDRPDPSHGLAQGPPKADDTPPLRGGRLAGPNAAGKMQTATGLPRKTQARPVADSRMGTSVHPRMVPTTSQNHGVLSDQMQDLTNAIQQFIIPKSSQRCIRLPDYSSCPIPAEPTHWLIRAY